MNLPKKYHIFVLKALISLHFLYNGNKGNTKYFRFFFKKFHSRFPTICINLICHNFDIIIPFIFINFFHSFVICFIICRFEIAKFPHILLPFTVPEPRTLLICTIFVMFIAMILLQSPLPFVLKVHESLTTDREPLIHAIF